MVWGGRCGKTYKEGGRRGRRRETVLIIPYANMIRFYRGGGEKQERLVQALLLQTGGEGEGKGPRKIEQGLQNRGGRHIGQEGVGKNR